MTSTRQQRRARSRREGQWVFALVLFGLVVSSLSSGAPAFSDGWFAPTVVLTGAMIAIGAGIRRLSADGLNGRITAWWLQALFAIVALLGFEALRSGFELGPLETAVSFGRSFATGIGDIAWYHAIPIPVEDNVQTAIMSGGALLVLLNDLVMRVVRLPVVAVLWLFLPITLPLQLGRDPIYVATIALAVLFAIALVLSSDRAVKLRKRAMAAVAAVAAAVVALPLILPNPGTVEVSPPAWLVQDGTGMFSAGAPILSTDIDLSTNLRRPEPVDVLEYRGTLTATSYLQLTTLGDVSQGGFTEYPEGAEIEQLPFEGRPDPFGYGDGNSVTVRSLGLRSDKLPVPVATTQVASDDVELGYDPLTVSYPLGGGLPSIPQDATWEAAVGPQFSLSWNAFSGTYYTPEPGRPHTELPEELAPLRDLARDIVADSDGSDIGMLQMLEWWFHDPSWQYSETVPFAAFGDTSGGQWDSLLEFVEERVGYCVHYASLFTMLARALDIPSRVVVGFLPGRVSDEQGWRIVSTNDMHAWSEVYLENFGWVTVDVTPPILAGRGQASETDDSPWGPDGTRPTDGPSEQPSDPAVSPSASDSPSDSPEATDDPSLAPDPSTSPSGSDPPDIADDDAGGGDEAAGMHPGWLVTLLVLFVLLLPIAVRYGIRLTRLADGATGVWRETIAQAADAGVSLPKNATTELLAGVIGARLSDDAQRALARLRRAAEAEAFGEQTSARGGGDPMADAAEVAGELWQQLSAGEAALRRLLPASLLPEPLRPDPADKLPSNG